MTDSDVPVRADGGASAHQPAPLPRVASGASSASPSVPAVNPPTRFGGIAGTEPGSTEDLLGSRFSRTGSSPIAYLAVALVAIAASWWAMDWSKLTAGATNPSGASEWWVNISSVLLPGEDARFGFYSEFRMRLALGLLIVAGIAVALWIGRIGSNLRPGQAPFGAFLPVVALPAWWLLPLTIGITSDSTRSTADLLVRYLVAFAILFAQFLLLRWPTLNRIWRAGHIRYDLISIILWLPMMIPWMIWMGANIYTFITIGDSGTVADSKWIPTPAMLDWARWVSRASGLGILLLLLVVSVLQHEGMRLDRSEEDARRLARRTVRPFEP